LGVLEAAIRRKTLKIANIFSTAILSVAYVEEVELILSRTYY
jgi:hypothetical protein